MADVDISKYRAQVVRDGFRPSNPGFVESEGQNPVDPAGSGQNHLPVTIGTPANGLAVTEAQVLTIDKAQIFAGTSSQFVKGDGTLDSTAYGTGSVTSVALTMPAAFSVANSPVTTAGTLAVTGAGTTAQYIRGDGTLATFPSLTGFVPYTGATADVNLGTHDLAAERGTFENNGSSNTLTVNHTSGSGYGIIVTKGGNNEALYVSKTSGSGNAMTVVGGRTSLVDLALSSVTNTAGDFLTLSAGVVHKRTAAEVRTDIGAGTGNGTVTSVAALTLGTSGTDLSSTVANGTTTPVITLNVPTASASNRGALSAADWSTFNSKQNAIGYTPVPETRTITINGTTQDLSANRTFNVGDMILGDVQTVTARKDFNTNTLQLVVNGTSQKTVVTNSPIDSGSYSLSINAFGFNASNNIYFSKGGNNNGIFEFNNAATRIYTLKDASGTLAFTSDIPSLSGYVQGSGTTNYLPKFTGSTTIGNSALQETNGNLGLGVTPSAWLSNFKALQVGDISSFYSGFDGTYLANNTFVNTSSQSIYLKSLAATVYLQNGGNHIWFNAPSGTAGNVQTFTQAMTLTSGGNLLVGTTTDGGFKLDVNGTGRFSNILVANSDIHQVSTGGLYWGAASTYVIGVTGNTANGNLSFITGSTVKATITSGGNVGIGTTSVVARLTVVGASTVIGQTNVSARFSDDLESTLLISHPSGTSNTATITGNNQLAFATGTVGSIAERIRITSGGNVLIGTTTDNGGGQKLQVNGSLLINSFDLGNETGIFFRSGAASSFKYNLSILAYDHDAGGSADGISINGFDGVSICTGANTRQERMRVTLGGNVLIGTATNGSSKLRIVGLPTSAAGLSSGDVYNLAGVLMIA